MNKNELALTIGNMILNTIQKMQTDKKDFGQDLIIPFKLPNISDQPDFIYSVKIQMPRFSKINLDGSITSFTMAEYYNWEKNE